MTTAPQSLHQKILGDLQGKILSGKLAPGARIATEHELAEAYDCSRMTVSNVLAKLARAGLVERRRKAGTFVTRPQSQAAVLEIHDIKAEVLALGQAYRMADQLDAATEYLTAALELCRAHGDQHSLANVLHHLGTVAWSAGNNFHASLYHQEALELCARLEVEDIVTV